MADLWAEVGNQGSTTLSMSDSRCQILDNVTSEPDVHTPYPKVSDSFTSDMDVDSKDMMNESFDENFIDHEEDVEGDTESLPPDGDERKAKDKFNVESLSYELQVGYRILSNLMSAGNRCANKLFLYPVDDAFPETADYYEKIKEPMWMFKMKEKFEKQEYSDLTEFMVDFRLMIENCYRYNGPDHFVSKKAQKLETMMKQKVALLSRDLRDKLTVSLASNSDDDLLTSAGVKRRIRQPNITADDPSQQLLTKLRRDRELQERVDRRQKVEDKKALEQAKFQEMQNWEDNLLGPEVKELIRSMWELPQIGMFVYLCMESLGLEEEVTQYQIERGLAAPRECSDFRRLMTSLLSTPHQRKSLKSFMPYHVWNSKLTKKVDYFYKVLADRNGNQAQTCYLLGLDTRAFKIMGKSNPLLKKQFHQLSYLKRVWIIKNFCDFCIETQPYLQKTIDEIECLRPMDVREVFLGCDGRGNRYINFPMFTGKDIRIYKHSKHPEPNHENLHMEDWCVPAEQASASSSRCSTPVNKRNQKATETPSSSLRAKAMLQSAESEEASPLRDVSQCGSEARDGACPGSGNRSSLPPSGGSLASVCRLKPPSSTKKRKRTSLFLTKRKRFKHSKKAEADKQVRAEVRKDGTNLLPNAAAENNIADDSSIMEESMCDAAISDKEHNENDGGKCDSDILVNNSKRKDESRSSQSGSPDTSTSGSSPVSLSTQGLNQNPDVRSSGDRLSLEKKNPCDEGANIKLEPAEVNSVICCDVDSGVSACSSHVDNSVDSKLDENCRGIVGINKTCDTPASLVGAGPSLHSDNAVKSEDSGQDSGRTNVLDVKSGLPDCDKCETMNDVKNGYEEQVVKTDADNASDPAKTEVSDGDFGKHAEENDQKDSARIKQEAVKEEVAEKQPKKEEEEDNDSCEEDVPDRGQLELVAESMEDMRELMKKLSNPDPVKRGKRYIPATMKPCQEELLASVTRFYDELLKYERSLSHARVGMQTKLRKEVDSYVEPKLDDVKSWDSDNSQSSKDVTDDEDSRMEEHNTKQSKKTKAKPSVSTLLSSAASKLTALTGEENGDSNDSFELDISSRGRLRKRRIIPNNTEDTGLKKRKNIPSQELSVQPMSNTSIVTSTTSQVPNSIQRSVPTTGPASHISIIMPQSSHPSHSAIRGQLASQGGRTAGQIVQLMTSAGDGRFKTVHLDKSGLVLSPQNLANLRLVTRPADSASIARNRIVTSSAQNSHPVMQQLLLNQARAPAQVTLTNSAGYSAKTTQSLQVQLTGANGSSQNATYTLQSPGNISSMVRASPATSQPAPMVVTQVTSSASDAGRHVIDLGSLSVTQLQQLMKNQAIQINTGSGNMTTLLLTSGLQPLSAGQPLPLSAAGTAVGRSAVMTATGKAAPAQAAIPPNQAASSAVTSPMVRVIQQPQLVLSGGKTSSWLTIPTQTPARIIRAQVAPPPQPPAANMTAPNISSATLIPSIFHSAGIPTTSAPFSHISSTTGAIQTSTLQIPTTISKQLAGSMAAPAVVQRQPLLVPRIVSSPALTGAGRITLGTNSAPVTQRVIPCTASNNPWTLNSEILKSRVITAPLLNLSPSKKYANNVTVKALIENQNKSTKKSAEETNSDVSSNEQLQPVVSSVSSSSSNLAHFVSLGSKVESRFPSNTTLLGQTVSDTKQNSLQNETISKNIKEVQMYKPVGANSIFSGTIGTSQAQHSVIPVTHQIWVDTTLQSITSTSGSNSEIILPTMNIKIPTPNTLPSLLHNKNGTTIVQSTKVPIPVVSEAKTAESLSPTANPASVNIPVGSSSLQNTKIQPLPGNMILMSNNMMSAQAGPGSISTCPINSFQNLTGTVSRLPPSLVGSKSVTLKLTPQVGSAGQFVQGFVTPQGLVLPQSALLQQMNQGGGNIFIANTLGPRAVSQLPPQGQFKIQPSSLVGTGNQQSFLSLASQPATAAVAASGDNNIPALQKVVLPLSGSLVASSANLQGGVLNPKPSSGINVMLMNNSSTACAGSSSGALTSTATSGNLKQNIVGAVATIATTPASEMVKQMTSGAQLLQRNPQHAVQASGLNEAGSQHNASQLLSSIIQGSVLQHNTGLLRTTGGVSNQAVATPPSLNSHSPAQFLALPQNSSLQQSQSNIILSSKPISAQGLVSGPQTKPPFVTFQLQQAGQFVSNGEGAKTQLAGAQQIQQPQVVTIQKPMGLKVPQGGQVFHLSINQPNLMSQPTQGSIRAGHPLSPQQQPLTQNIQQTQPQSVIAVQHQQLVPQPHQQLVPQQQQLVAHQQHQLVPQQQQQQLIPQQQQQQQPQLVQQQLQPSQNFIIQSGLPQQSVLGNTTINMQTNLGQPGAGIQQPLVRAGQQPASKPQHTVVGKVHFNSSPNVQLLNPSQTPHIVLSHVPTASASGAPIQTPIQFLINSAPVSVSALSVVPSSAIVSSSNSVTLDSFKADGNISRVIRADSNMMPSLSSQNTSMFGMSAAVSPQNDLGQAMLVGSSAVNSSPAGVNKLGTHMIISNSEAANQFLISPVKLAPHNSQAVANPIKYINAISAQSPGGLLGISSNSSTIRPQLLNTSLADLHGSLGARPAVIYANQPSATMEKSDGKVAQLLLSQPVGQLNSDSLQQSQIVNSGQYCSNSSTVHQSNQLVADTKSTGTDSNISLNTKTFLYKIGDQYFSPATLPQVPPQTALTPNILMAAASSTKPNVQFLVPPSFIEASDQYLKGPSKVNTPMTSLPAPSLFSAASSSNSSSEGGRMSHVQGAQMNQARPIVSFVDTPNPSPVLSSLSSGAVNGGVQNHTQFSFSLSGPASVTSKPLMRSDVVTETATIRSRQVPPDYQNGGGLATYSASNQQLQTGSSEATLTRNAADLMSGRSYTFSDGQDVYNSQKGGPLSQRHILMDDTALTLKEQDEKEAALNLLTLANQQIERPLHF